MTTTPATPTHFQTHLNSNRRAASRSKADKARGGAATSIRGALGKGEAVAELGIHFVSLFLSDIETREKTTYGASVAQSPTNRPAAGGRVRRGGGLAAAGGAAAVVDAGLARVDLAVGLGSRRDEGREGEDEGGEELHLEGLFSSKVLFE